MTAGAPGRAVDVLLVDDDPQVCAHLAAMLGGDGALRVVGRAHDGPAAVREAGRLRPDVVLLDLRMPGGDGLDAVAPLSALGARVVVLTAFDSDRDVDAALHHGAAGYVLKSSAPHDLVHVVRAAAAGHQVLAPPVVRRLSRRATHEAALAAMIRRTLTDRELETLRSLAAGMSNGQIADDLGIGVPTVKGHVSALVRKLGCSSRLQAALLARDAGIDRV